MDSYAPTRRDVRPKDGSDGADGMAVASFVLGLVGLLAFNIVLGPFALVLGGVALVRGTKRPVRAIIGLVLGAADLMVLVVLLTMNKGLLLPFGS
ncbi:MULTISPECIES: DUF4190 domain-containing protein [unclassified Streptomyces]|uniref:DUF4190 domain-containing protein n=1 Tax=unclassified Streptomyces TaxID=2593676 RepID=UPI0037F3D7CE